eukprot:NODE_17126_length_960_cov_3.632653.p1 GENE.NODE_17126_length_960_cov_3.632653~~NODE_17126_length_960_cov_3.632653.p1  ORF type:complete len:226 (-),score=57.96 NODE_17126_length_960_cov_3.632653:197-874(-)
MVVPPAVRIVVLGLYLWGFHYGTRILVNPRTDAETLRVAAAYAAPGLMESLVVYVLDCAFTVLPMRWISMHGIPPQKVLGHHLPLVLHNSALVSVALAMPSEFEQALVATPTLVTYIGSGCLMPLNETQWVFTSCLPKKVKKVVESRYYFKLQAASSVLALLVVFFISVQMAVLTITQLGMALYVGKRELDAVGAMFMASCFILFLVAPFVQMPLLRKALRKLVR